jgi:hypothetical protein
MHSAYPEYLVLDKKRTKTPIVHNKYDPSETSNNPAHDAHSPGTPGLILIGKPVSVAPRTCGLTTPTAPPGPTRSLSTDSSIENAHRSAWRMIFILQGVSER